MVVFGGGYQKFSTYLNKKNISFQIETVPMKLTMSMIKIVKDLEHQSES